MTEPMVMRHAGKFPDGSLQLVVRKPGKNTDLVCCKATDAITCDIGRHANRCGDALPAGCRDRIQPGEFFLLHTFKVIFPRPRGRRFAICAACAVRECNFWDVQEVPQ